MMNDKDTIYRQKAIDAILQFMPAKLRDDATVEEQINYVAWRCALGCAVSSVGTQPSAEPDGRWEIIHPGETGYSAGDFRCSVCGQPNKCYHLTKYCCNCGARMVNRGKVKKEKR